MIKEINSLRCRLCLKNESQYYLSCSCLYCQECLSQKFFNLFTSNDVVHYIRCSVCQQKISKNIQEIQGTTTFQKKVFLEKLKADKEIQMEMHKQTCLNETLRSFLISNNQADDSTGRLLYLKELYYSLQSSLPKFDIPIDLIAQDDEDILKLKSQDQQKENNSEEFVTQNDQTFQKKKSKKSDIFEAYESQLLKHGIKYIQEEKTTFKSNFQII